MLQMITAFALFLSSLTASPLPQEGALHRSRLSNGVKVWLQNHTAPPGSLSLRVVWQQGEELVERGLDCPSDEFDEIGDFLTECRDAVTEPASAMKVVAVGDFNPGKLVPLIGEALAELRVEPCAKRVGVISKPSIGASRFSLAYAMPLPVLSSSEEVKSLFATYCLQELLHARLSKSLRGATLPSSKGVFPMPRPSMLIHVRNEEVGVLEVLSDLLLEMQRVGKSGFQDEEFSSVIGKLQRDLLSFYQKAPDNRVLATYYASLPGEEAPAYAPFMQSALLAASEMSLREVYAEGLNSFKEEHRSITVATSEEVKTSQIEELLAFFKTDVFIPGLVEKEVGGGPLDSYARLPISEKEAATIWSLLDTMANNNPIKLGFKQSDLKKKGEEIMDVHPLKFLGTAFSDSHLKWCMSEISTSYFKWDGFMNGTSDVMGFGEKMAREHARDNLMPHLAGFSQAVKASPEHLRLFIQKEDWEGLVKYLIQAK